MAFGPLDFWFSFFSVLYVEGQKHVKSKGLGQHDVCMEYQMKLSILLVYYIVYVYILVEVVALLTSLSLAFMATLHTTSMLPTTFIVWAEKLLLPFTKVHKDDFASNPGMSICVCAFMVVLGRGKIGPA